MYFVPADYREGGELDLLLKAIIENAVTREVLENKAEIAIDDAE